MRFSAGDCGIWDFGERENGSDTIAVVLDPPLPDRYWHRLGV
jgi:hypothetical protein